MKRKVRRGMLGCLPLVLLACSGDDPTESGTTGSTVAHLAARTGATTQPVTSRPEVEWTRHVPGGDCQCAGGTEFSFWEHRGDATKVVLFFQGGGVCFNAETCDPASGAYKPAVVPGDNPAGRGGIFDLADERNPLAGHSFIYVPYCTGDMHLGDATTTYIPGRTVHHAGAVNAAAAIAHLAARYPDATDVLVAGESAGAVPAPLYAGDVSDVLPDAAIVVLADGSGAYADIPAVNALLSSTWGALNALPAWSENPAETPEAWSFPGLFVRAGRHDPTITFARHDYAYDAMQAFVASSLAGSQDDELVVQIDSNEQQIEAAGVDLLSYIAPGTGHTVLSRDMFYSEVVSGVRFRDWVADLVAGVPVADVHCTDCQPAGS